MRLRDLLLITSVLVFGAGRAEADQWGDAIQWNETNVRAPIAPLVLSNPAYAGYAGWAQTPTTNLYVLAPSESCVGSTGPTFAGNPQPGFPPIFPANCASAGNTFIDINQFARQSVLVGLQSEFAALSAQIAATNAQFAQALHAQARLDDSGVAQALAMAGTTDLQPDEYYAVSVNIGTFHGQTAFAGGAAARLDDHVSVNAGVTAGANGGAIGARAGIRFGW